MKKIDFNQAWTFCRVGEETVKREVMIPHDAMILKREQRIVQVESTRDGLKGMIIFMRKNLRFRMNMKNRKLVSNSRVFTIMRKCI